MIIILEQKATPEEFEQAREIYNDYIKTVIDIEKNILAIGGEYHIDCEEVLIRSGSKLEHLYGGGFRISTGAIEYMAMSNFKPSFGKMTYEIMDEKIRQQLKDLTEKYLIM